MYYMPDRNQTNFNPSPSSSNEVASIISSLENKSCHVNTIPIYIYKKINHLIAPIISNIFNESILQGRFPSALKIARITPIYKNKFRKIVQNYRPISILNTLSKILEKLMKTRAVQFIEDNNLLFHNQFGFRSGCSTTDAILRLTDDCTNALDKRLYTLVIFLDFSKAFDTVNKDIMLKKLDRLGFRGPTLNFFDSYLTDRRLFVEINGRRSSTKITNIGLPQGAVQSTWMFSLYINDMHRASDKFKFIHFADDTTIYMTDRNLQRLTETACEELSKIDEWLKANRLSLNVDKTHYMMMTHKTYDPTTLNIKIRNQLINHVTTTKFLGVTIDNKLNYNTHVSSLSKQLSRIRGISYRISYLVPPTILKNIYYALFYSRLVYAMPVWGGCGATNINKIRNINRSAINLFNCNLPNNASLALPYDSVYKLISLTIFHKFKTGTAQENHFRDVIHSLTPQQSVNTRLATGYNYTIPKYSKSMCHNQFLYNAIKLWNSLPPHIASILSTETFKRDLKKFLYTQLIL